MRALVSVLTVVATATPAFAADIASEPVEVPVAVEARDIIIDLGIGVQLEPEFPSSEKYTLAPFPVTDLRFLRLPLFGEVVGGGPQGAITVYPSFNFIGERDDRDADYLEDTDDIDTGFDLGPGVAVRAGPFRAFTEVRFGIAGHGGVVVDAGVDFIGAAFDRFEVQAGPRVSLASDDYMDTYFGVSDDAAELDAYDPDGGFKDVGAEAQLSYALTETFRVIGKAGYTYYVGDANDSPIVEAGNEHEFTVGIGFSYRFGLDVF